MANFTIRVELRGNPPIATYEKLHALMAKHGFKQTIYGTRTDGQSANFDMPHATYYGASISGVGSVRDTLGAAIRSEVQSNIIVFVGHSLALY